MSARPTATPQQSASSGPNHSKRRLCDDHGRSCLQTTRQAPFAADETRRRKSGIPAGQGVQILYAALGATRRAAGAAPANQNPKSITPSMSARVKLSACWWPRTDTLGTTPESGVMRRSMNDTRHGAGARRAKLEWTGDALARWLRRDPLATLSERSFVALKRVVVGPSSPLLLGRAGCRVETVVASFETKARRDARSRSSSTGKIASPNTCRPRVERHR